MVLSISLFFFDEYVCAGLWLNQQFNWSFMLGLIEYIEDWLSN